MYIPRKLPIAVAVYLNVAIKEELGSGHFGTAYLLEDGRVMKITDDDEEYATAILLKDKEFRHIVKIFEAYKMTTQDGNKFFVIIREYLEEPQYLESFEARTDFGETIRWFFQGLSDVEEVRERTAQLKMSNPDLADYIDQYWQVCEDCMRAGFTRVDIKAANLGVKDGVLKLLDTGWSGQHLDYVTETITLKTVYNEYR